MRLIQNYRESGSLIEWLRRLTEAVAVIEEWREIGTTGNPAFQNSWANVGGATPPAGFYIDPYQVVHLRGNIDTGTSGTVAFTLPTGYRPEYNTFRIAYNDNGGPGPGGAAVSIQIQADGDVIPTFGAGTDAWLDGISFRV